MKTIACLTAALALTALPPARAGRPLQAEDAGIIERGRCEIEGAWQGLAEPQAPRATGASLQLGCGVGATSQLALALLSSRAAGRTTQGLRLGGKSELWRSGDADAAAVALAWGLTAEKPSGQSWRHAGTDVSAVASLPVEGATIHANLGHARDHIARQRRTTWALAYEHAGSGAWAPMGELFGDDRAAPWWNLGLRWAARPQTMFLDVSYGRQIAPGRPRLLSAGVKLTW